MKHKTVLQTFADWLAENGYYKDGGMRGKFEIRSSKTAFVIRKVGRTPSKTPRI